MNIFEIFGKIGIKNNDANSAIDQTNDKAQKLAEKFKSVGNTVTNFGQKVTVGTGIVLGSIATLTKSSIDAYAEYEQLIGGVETLFGKSSKTVVKYAEGAYKTAGLSANDYMSTVTSFSASLLQSLGGDTDKAAQYAHRAVTDMSDNANKMGTDMSMIQNAYQGFAKQNYTMLDNLKLGYGGTKGEMQRLIEDASKMTGVQKQLGITVDESSMSFGNIVNAISVVQANMGIMGTTAAEAEKTISGSVSAMKASWTNLLTGMADDNADFEALFNTFIDNVVQVAKNLAPRIEIVLTTLAKKVLTGLKSMTDGLPPIFGQVIDKLIALAENFRSLDGEQKKQILKWIGLAAAIGPIITVVGKVTTGVGGLISAFSPLTGKIGKIIADNDGLAKSLTKVTGGMGKVLNPVNLVKGAFGGLKSMFTGILPAVQGVIVTFNASGGGLSGVLAVTKMALGGVASGFTGLLGAILPVAAPIVALIGVIIVLRENWDKVVGTFKAFIENTGIVDKFKEIKDKVMELWDKIKGLKDLFVVVGSVVGAALVPAISILAGLFNGVVSAISPLIDAIGGVIDILAGLGSLIVGIFTGDMKKAGDAVDKIGEGIKNVFGGLWDAVKGFLKGFVDGVVGFFKGLWDTLVGHSIVPDTINGVIDWFKELLGKPIQFVKDLKDKVVNFFGNLKDKAIEKAKGLLDGAKEKFNSMKSAIVNKAKELKDGAVNKFNELKNGASEKIENLKTAANEKFSSVKEAVSSKVSELKEAAVNKFNEMKENASEKFEALKSAANSKFESIKSAISDKVTNAKNKVSSVFDSMNSASGGKLGTLVNTVKSKFDSVKNSISEKMTGAKDKVTSILSDMKTKFNDWKAKLKMPHIKITGKWDLKKGKFPKFSVEWYKKAMNQAMILDEPTIFGMNGNGQLMGGGEAGSEMIVGTDYLMKSFQKAVAIQNYGIQEELSSIRELLTYYLSLLLQRNLVLDSGELVGVLAPLMDKELGDIEAKKRRRGR